MEDLKLKEIVKEKYGEIAKKSLKGEESGCCSSTCCSSDDISDMSESYENLSGYNPDADLSLGCGIPTEFAAIKQGDTVVDLGSGAGNDVFVARSLTGEKGKVIGIDFTETMIEKAILNKQKLGYENIEFHLGDIENIPMDNDIADVVISNCVLNLVPDKNKAFSEIYRILKPGGHFSVSDIVVKGEMPAELKKAAEMYAGCISGSIDINEYLGIIKKNNFTDIKIQKEREIILPEDTLRKYLSGEEYEQWLNSGSRLLSVNVFGRK